jgi:hypothetical protein
MATTLETIPAPALGVLADAAAAILTAGCDGYRAGTTGRVHGHRQGCLEFAPDAPDEVARWARPRTSLLVPPGFVATVAEV